jgi:hypothetical protein
MIKLKITGEQIKNLLSEHHVTQTKAAELCHVNPRTFRRWVAGDIPMPVAAWELLRIKLLGNGQGMDFGFGVLEFGNTKYSLLERAHEFEGIFSACAIDIAGNEYTLRWCSSEQVKSVELIQSLADKLDRAGGNYSLLKWGGEVSKDDILRVIPLIVRCNINNRPVLVGY